MSYTGVGSVSLVLCCSPSTGTVPDKHLMEGECWVMHAWQMFLEPRAPAEIHSLVRTNDKDSVLMAASTPTRTHGSQG